ncbi:unnamed protein product [Linum trigynum]|uniref:CCHC-type domain-containing protein n=1 Tax=Linum trigynum TaxID=586398 RepID=A0AAV2DM10_9ROSI
MVVWIQFPAFSVHFYHKEILFTLGNMVGRSIKLDFHTQHQQRAKFARMAVELDLSKPLVTRIRLDGKWQYIEYENLPTCCFECGKIGHTSTTCPSLTANTPEMVTGRLVSPTENWSEKPSEEKAGYGPWMQVSRRSRRGSRASEKGNSSANQGDSAGSVKAGKGKSLHKDMEGPNGQKEAPSKREETLRNGAIGKGKNVGTGQRNGKEGEAKEAAEMATGGKGVLGPIPSSNAGLILNATKAVLRAQNLGTTSTSAGNGPVLGVGSVKHPRSKGSSSSGPPTTQSISGPNATAIQIVAVPSIDSQRVSERKAATPSAATRTKKQTEDKKKKTKPHKSPRKVTARALQVWTPVKEKKAKSRTRLATLTLQEIAAWTEAAKSGQPEETLATLAEDSGLNRNGVLVAPDPAN